MDPNANYEEQLRIAQDLIEAFDDDSTLSEEESKGLRLAELVLALAEWRSKGGFLPKALEG